MRDEVDVQQQLHSEQQLLSQRKIVKLGHARTALNMPQPDRAAIESVQAFMQRVAHLDTDQCPNCPAGRLRVVEVSLKHLPIRVAQTLS